jgi:hypothetical protein
MKLMITIAATLLLITSALADPVNTRAVQTRPTHVIIPPPDRYFDTAHGPDDPYSVWFAGDYVGRDPDLSIRAAMIRER